MALNLIGSIYLISDTGAGDSGDVYTISWDDSTETISVSYHDDSSETDTVITSGTAILFNEYQPPIGVEGWYALGYSNIGDGSLPIYSLYKFCDVNGGLNRFELQQGFPYFKRIFTPDHPDCAEGTTCDIMFYGLQETTGATGLTTRDGSITVTASSSYPIKFSKVERNRTTGLATGIDNGDGTYSYTFTNLAPGDYKIYAKDSVGCEVSKVITVGINETYATKYQFRYVDRDQNVCTLNIKKRAYSGDITTVKGSHEDPVVQTLEGAGNILIEKETFGSSLTFQILTETEREYLEFFTEGDETEFLAEHYINLADGNGEQLTFRGYLTQEAYSEPYERAPYVSQLVFTDRLADLDKYDFSIDEGNVTILQVLIDCLKKLKLENGFRIADNLYEANFDATDSDDPFTQTYADALSFWDGDDPRTCAEAVNMVIRSRRARLTSWGGYWYVTRLKEMASSTVDYREFDKDGVYVSNSSISPIIDFKQGTEEDRNVWIRGKNLSLSPIYNQVNIIARRKLKDSLVNPFNEKHLNGDGFIGWTPTLNGDEGSWHAVDKIKYNRRRGDGFSGGGEPIRGPRGYARPRIEIIDFTQVFDKYYYGAFFDVGQGGDSFIASKGSIEFTSNDLLVIDIPYFLALNYNAAPYYNLRWMFKLGSYWLSSDGTWTNSADPQNQYFVTNINSENTFSLTVEFREDIVFPTTENYEFRLYHVDPAYYDVEASTVSLMHEEIKDFPTASLDTGHRLIGRSLKSGSTYTYQFWELISLGSLTGSDSLLTPDDNSALRWALRNETVIGVSNVTNSITLFGSIKLLTLPNGEELPQEETTSYAVTENNVRELDYEVDLFDLNEDLSNTENLVTNYLKKSNLTGTNDWTEESSGFDYRIQEIIGREMVAYYKRPRYKISGSMLTDRLVAFWNTFRESTDGNKVYIQMGTSINWKRRTISGEIQELSNEVSDSGIGGREHSSDFSSDFS